MSQQMRNGYGFDFPVPVGQSMLVSSITGTYTATIVAGPGKGTALATDSTGGGTYGPYSGGVVIRLQAGANSLIDYDIAVSPALTYSGALGVGYNSSGDVASAVDGAGNVVAVGGAPALKTLAEMLAYTPATDGAEVYVTDLPSGTRGRFYWHLASGKWRPAGMVLVDRSLTLDSGVNSTAEQYLKNLSIPAGLLFTGAEILFEYSLARSNSTDAGAAANMRIGNAGTIADTAFGGGSGFGALTSSTRANGNSHRYRVASATEIEKGGTGSAQGASFAASGSSMPVALWNVGSTTSRLYFAPTVQLAAATGTTLPQVGYCALWLLPS